MREASPGEFEQLRRAHFNTENNIKLIGIVVMLCAFALLEFARANLPELKIVRAFFAADANG